MTEQAREAANIEAAFGFTIDEIVDWHRVSSAFLGSVRVRSALGVLEREAPGSSAAIYNMLTEKTLSKPPVISPAGHVSLGFFSQNHVSADMAWFAYLEQVLSAPASHRDTADWWLLFSALEAAVEFQLTQMAPPKTEPRLSGDFITELKHAGLQWAKLLAPLLKRRNASFAYHQIDLERLGGEQETGADFGLVLDFDGSTALPITEGQTARIVPLVFQAKRYIRPSADISQTHEKRGPQREKLKSNRAASAYILYENGKVEDPLPVLVKSVDNVGSDTVTSVFTGTVDFATFLYRASIDETFAPRAASVEEALSMIYAKADRGQLSHLLVASGRPNAKLLYQSALDHFAAQYEPDLDDADDLSDEHIEDYGDNHIEDEDMSSDHESGMQHEPSSEQPGTEGEGPKGSAPKNGKF